MTFHGDHLAARTRLARPAEVGSSQVGRDGVRALRLVFRFAKWDVVLIVGVLCKPPALERVLHLLWILRTDLVVVPVLQFERVVCLRDGLVLVKEDCSALAASKTALVRFEPEARQRAKCINARVGVCACAGRQCQTPNAHPRRQTPNTGLALWLQSPLRQKTKLNAFASKPWRSVWQCACPPVPVSASI